MIETVTNNNIEDVLPLIRQYQEFYKIKDIDEDKNREFFSQFSEDGEKGCLFLFRNDEGIAVAFATVYFTFVSTLPGRVGVMNDLYTAPRYRGKGIGKSLIEHCLKYALAQGAARLQWLTAQNNTQAQKLYDSLDAQKSEWIAYALSA